jgi:hypothetical protein
VVLRHDVLQQQHTAGCGPRLLIQLRHSTQQQQQQQQKKKQV